MLFICIFLVAQTFSLCFFYLFYFLSLYSFSVIGCSFPSFASARAHFFFSFFFSPFDARYPIITVAFFFFFFFADFVATLLRKALIFLFTKPQPRRHKHKNGPYEELYTFRCCLSPQHKRKKKKNNCNLTFYKNLQQIIYERHRKTTFFFFGKQTVCVIKS